MSPRTGLFFPTPSVMGSSFFPFSCLQAIDKGAAYSKEGDSDDDAAVLGARDLVDGVADVAVGSGGAAEATGGLLSFGRHVWCAV